MALRVATARSSEARRRWIRIHFIEQILGVNHRFTAGLRLAPAVREVGEIDDETALLGRDQIDGPRRRIGQLEPR